MTCRAICGIYFAWQFNKLPHFCSLCHFLCHKSEWLSWGSVLWISESLNRKTGLLSGNWRMTMLLAQSSWWQDSVLCSGGTDTVLPCLFLVGMTLSFLRPPAFPWSLPCQNPATVHQTLLKLWILVTSLIQLPNENSAFREHLCFDEALLNNLFWLT